MRVGLIPENRIEWILDKFGFVPRATLETFHAAVQSRTVMVAAKLGVFEAIAAGAQSTLQIASSTATDACALEKLLNVLAASKYLTLRHGKWELRPHVRRWVLRSGRHSIADCLLHAFLQWKSLENLECFVRTGEPLDIHAHLAGDDLIVYHRAMKAIASLASKEVVGQVRLPQNPKRMLDIGGSHGAYSAAFCRKYPTMEAVILDLPDAIEQAAPLLAEEKMGSRVVHRPGNALTDSLGQREWDFVFVSQVLHHFTAEINQSLCIRIQKSLKLGGRLVISEIERSSSPKIGGQFGTIFDLYFASTSCSGTWSQQQMQAWQANAGMKTSRPTRLWTVPGLILMPAQAVPEKIN
jgi:2-polyprenyl-3-methyl-5-hydroxy-6-metoxy-1,4-benzoquinol methylase